MTIRFGTDGVRGRAFDELTLVDAFLIGRAAAEVLEGSQAVIGRDTRESGPAFVEAVAAGLRTGGFEVVDLGIAPTPAVAHTAGRRDAIGVVVSASHNPWYDNGIKLFSRLGSKLGDAEQASVERRLDELHAMDEFAGAAAEAQADAATPLPSIQPEIGRWVESVRQSIDVDLGGLHVVIDCAHGAASHVVPPGLADLGAEVTAIGVEPDGRNINDGYGSTHPETLAETVVEVGADVGIALDGDADRLVAVAADGSIVDGDHLMAMLAADMNARGVLHGSRLVVTVMSNLGLLRAMQAAGIEVEVTPVGDRNVLIAMERLGASFGGEQSGHLVFADHEGTGDGFLSAVQLLGYLKRSGRPLQELAAESMTVFPQVLRNVAVATPMPDVATRIAAEIADVEARLGDDGRVLVRPSGTEPVVRVMVEASDPATAATACDQLCRAVERLAS